MRRQIHDHGSCRSILFHLDENKKMMLDQINRDEGVNLLQQIGLDAEDAFQWLEKAQTLVFGHSDFKKESLDCGKLCQES